MSAKKRIIRIGTALAAAAALSVGLTGVANAANQDAVKNTNELIYYYNSGLAGAWSDFSVNVSNLAGYSYIGGGKDANGFGYAVKNNAAAIQNKSTTRTVTVYLNSGYQNTANVCLPGCSGNLTPALKNNNASHRWS
jgi:hypothetical protein